MISFFRVLYISIFIKLLSLFSGVQVHHLHTLSSLFSLVSMPRLKINLEAIERESNANAEGFSADGGVRVGSLLVSSEGVRDSAGHYYELSLNDFDVVPVAEGGFLGRGSSGSVRRAVHRRSGTVVALKEIKVTGKAHMSEIRRELETLHAGDSAAPHLVNFYGAFTHEGSVFIAMEAMDGSLQEIAKPVPLPVLACMTRQMLKGITYLHRTRHLMHRDLKPSNVLFSSRTGDIKISDFGVSSFLECTKADAHSFVGTVTYMSPERLHGDSYSYSADIWSLGLVVAELAIGLCPFAGLRGESSEGRFWALIQHLNGAGPALELPPDMESSLVDFINACVVKAPEQRATSSELLTHPFIKKFTTTATTPPLPPPSSSTDAADGGASDAVSRAALCPVPPSTSLLTPPAPVALPNIAATRSPILGFPATRLFNGFPRSESSHGSGPTTALFSTSAASSPATSSSPQDRHETEAEEDFADHAVIQQWMRTREERAARHRQRRHGAHHHTSRASPHSDAAVGGSGSNADTPGSPADDARYGSQGEGSGASTPGQYSGDSGSACVSCDGTTHQQPNFDSHRSNGEPSVNLDDELNKLLF